MHSLSESININILEQRHEFHRILTEKDITTFYQPIMCLNDSKPFGYEALTRGPENSYFFNPMNLFPFAEAEDQLFPIEKLARETAVRSSKDFIQNGEKLFLNFSPKIIHDPHFSPGMTMELLEEHHLKPQDVIFEITERHAIDDFRTFRQALNHYRNQGFQIAVDDAGSGYSSAQAIFELAPDYIKIDRSLIQGIHNSDVKEKIVEAFISIAKKANSKVIAEGIETGDELAKILELGVDYGQGYFVGYPANPVKPISDKVLMKVKMKALHKDSIYSLASPVYTLGINCRPDDISESFNNNPNLDYILLTKEDTPVSLIKRKKWCNQQLTFGNVHPCQYSRNFIIADYKEPVHEIVKKIMAQKDPSLQEVIVAKDDYPMGVVTILDIMNFLAKSSF